MQQVLHRGRSLILADEHRRVIGVEGELVIANLLGSRAEEAVDGAAVVSAAEPAVGGAEPERGDVGLIAHGVDGGEQAGCVDAVHLDGGGGAGHDVSFRFGLGDPVVGDAVAPPADRCRWNCRLLNCLIGIGRSRVLVRMTGGKVLQTAIQWSPRSCPPHVGGLDVNERY